MAKMMALKDTKSQKEEKNRIFSKIIPKNQFFSTLTVDKEEFL
jgi:hypothetical protein